MPLKYFGERWLIENADLKFIIIITSLQLLSSTFPALV
jgi:hypothetical protein